MTTRRDEVEPGLLRVLRRVAAATGAARPFNGNCTRRRNRARRPTFSRPGFPRHQPRRRWRISCPASSSRNAGISFPSSRMNEPGFRCRARTFHNEIRKLACHEIMPAPGNFKCRFYLPAQLAGLKCPGGNLPGRRRLPAARPPLSHGDGIRFVKACVIAESGQPSETGFRIFGH